MFFKVDCVEYMKTVSDGFYDFVLGDPPYGNLDLINAAIKEGRRISQNGLAFFMYAEDLQGLEERPEQVVFWIKPISTKNTAKRYSRFVEVIALFDTSFVRTDLHWSNRSGLFTDSLIEAPIHPHGKPEALIERLLRNHCPEGGNILDPFSGGGTVERVADKIGMQATSLDIVGEDLG